MNTQEKSISEISNQATQILLQEMGIVDTFRFFGQFSVGEGDYTKERKKWLGDISLAEAIAQMKDKEKW